MKPANRLLMSYRILTNSNLMPSLRLWKVFNLWTNLPPYLRVGNLRVFTGYMNPHHRVRGGGSPTRRYRYLGWRLFKVA
jgi:hypothetical protein